MGHNHYNTPGGERQAPSKKKIVLNQQWQDISDSVTSPLIKRVTYYKYANRKIIAALKDIGEPTKAGAIYGCGTYVRVGLRNGHEVITDSNFCRQRLCQVCAWRRSAKFTAQMYPVIRNLAAKGYKWLFVTLTMQNPTAAQVRPSLDLLLKAWDKLLKRRKYKRIIQGFVRSVEVTYKRSDNTYHPHIHALWLVKSEYGTAGQEYISHDDLMLDWRDVLGIDYMPWVHIQTVKRRKSRQASTMAAAVETLKYSYKVDYNTINSETISVLLYALSGRRLVSFGGLVAQERLQLQQGDIDDNLNDDTLIPPQDDYDVLYLFSPAGWTIIDRSDADDV